MKEKILLFTGIFIFISNSYSQQIWKQNTSDVQAKVVVTTKKHKLLILDNDSFLSLVKDVSDRTSSKKTSSTILLPVENNAFEAFEIVGASNFSEQLALKFPGIKSYVGKSTESNKVARLSYSKHNGLRVFITTDHGTILIKPTDLKTSLYETFNKKDSELSSSFECGAIEKVHKVLDKSQAKTQALDNDGYLRKYRLAAATTGEYSNYFLTGNETSDAERKSVVLAALNTTLTRINGIFERDFGVTLELIPTNDEIIHLNANTDPFTSFGEQLLHAVQNHLDTEIGSLNYDIGHVLAHRFRNYGIAYPANVCKVGFAGKGSAFSSGPNLGMDDFYMVFAHELGHQLGTHHVQSSSQCRDPYEVGTAVEPGSGSTIMSYAGICSPNVQSSIDSYFNYVSIRDVISVTEDSDCAELISTGNNSPTVNAGNDYTIPKSTPFILEGTAEDADNNSPLSHTWEQNDSENPNSNGTPQPTRVYGPLFRSYMPTDVPVRYMPKLEDVVAGNLTPTWEVLPSVSRTMEFAFTVRDNAVFGPQTASDEMTVTVDGTSGPFTVTSQNSNTTWEVGEVRTVTWDVANTNQAPINATTVAIYLSTDGGYTYPITVATNVPNNGSYNIVVPEISISTSTARLMVRAENNIFYAINSSDINIDLSGFVMSLSTQEKDVCKDGEAIIVFDYKTVSGFNEMTTFSVENLPNGVTATFDPPTAINNNTEVTLTLSGFENLNQSSYAPAVVGNAQSKQRNAYVRLNLFDELPEPTLVSPENNASQIIPNSILVWEVDQNTETYTIELATDLAFSNIIEETTTAEGSFTPSQTEFNTNYYWRVRSDNVCETSDFSEVFTFKTKCEDPVDVTITDITYHSATISWIDNSSSSWEIKIIENASTPIESIFTANTNSYSISALNPSTSYDVYVRSLCSNLSDWIGPQEFTTPVSCPAPTGFDVDDITFEVAILSWINNGSETTWELEYGLEGFSQGTGTKILTTTNPHTMEGLVVGINYDVYLKAVCGSNPGDDDSNTLGPVTFKIPINYCEVGKFYDSGGPEGNYGKNDFITDVISSPEENTPITVIFNSFDLTETDRLWVTAEDIDLISYSGTNSPIAITSQTGKITFFFNANADENEETSAGWDATVICELLDCPIPSDFAIDDVTFNSADLSWTSNGSETQWELEYGLEGFTLGQGTKVLTSTNPHTLTGLSIDTNYEVYLKAICGINSGDDDSPWIGPQKFTTPPSCPAPTDFDVDDITFEWASLSWTSNGSETQWELEYGLEGFTPGQGTQVLTSTNPHTLEGLDAGINYDVYLKAICGSNPGDDDSNTLGPVTFTIPINYCEVGKFYDSGGPEENYKKGERYTLTISSPEENTPITVIFNSFDLAEPHSLLIIADDNFKSYRGTDSPGTITSQTGEISFNFVANTGDETSTGWDATVTCESPNCPMPSNFVVDGVTVNSVDLSWTSNGGEIQWELEYGLEGFIPGQGTKVLTSTNPHTLTGLSIDTNYEVYLKTICGINSGDDDSPWIGPQKFTTPLSCPAPTDFDVDNITFEAASLSWTSNGSETQWELEYGLEGFTPGQGTQVLTSTNPHTLEGLDVGINYDVYLKAVCGSNPCDDDSNTLGPVTFTIPINYCEVGKFYDSGGPEGNYEKGERYTLTISSPEENTPITVTFNSFDLAEPHSLSIYADDIDIKSYRGTDSPGTITSQTGEISFNFIANEGDETSTGWDATVTCESPSCTMPSNFVVDGVTFNSADLSWTSHGNETQWELEYGLKGFIPGQGTKVLTSTNPRTLAGLSVDTNYEVYLKAICGQNSGGDDSNRTGPLDFNLSEILDESEVSFDGFKYYPNPVKNKLTVEANEEITNVEIYNVVGQLIIRNQERLKKRVEIDFSNLSVGIYYIQSYSYDKIGVFKIIKQ